MADHFGMEKSLHTGQRCAVLPNLRGGPAQSDGPPIARLRRRGGRGGAGQTLHGMRESLEANSHAMNACIQHRPIEKEKPPTLGRIGGKVG